MLAIEKPFRPPAVRNESDSGLINKGNHWVEGKGEGKGFYVALSEDGDGGEAKRSEGREMVKATKQEEEGYV